MPAFWLATNNARQTAQSHNVSFFDFKFSLNALFDIMNLANRIKHGVLEVSTILLYQRALHENFQK
jgi:hypothetical protein